MSSCTLGDDQPQAEALDRPVAELDDLVEVLPGVDVHDRERHGSRPERLGRQVQHDHRVLAAGEQQTRTLERGGHLAEDVDGFGFERVEVGQLVRLGHTERSSAKIEHVLVLQAPAITATKSAQTVTVGP